jgi:hypothetical protein
MFVPRIRAVNPLDLVRNNFTSHPPKDLFHVETPKFSLLKNFFYSVARRHLLTALSSADLGCGSGSGTGSVLDPYSIGSVDPDPGGQKRPTKVEKNW